MLQGVPLVMLISTVESEMAVMILEVIILVGNVKAEQEQKKIQYKLEQEQKVLAQKEREKQEYEKGLAHIEKLRQQRKNPAKIYTIAQSEVGATGTVEHANIPTWEQTSAKETTKIPTE